MISQQRIFFDFLRFCIGTSSEIPESVKDADWKELYDIAKKQALLGVIFDGIQRLPKELAPDADLLIRWMGNALTIKRRNAVMYQASREVFSEIRQAGFRCCVLKGQGNAVGYPNPYSRSAGDVDVWVLADRNQLRGLALELAGLDGHVEREIVHHIELERKGVSIELHPTPMIFNNPVLNLRMQRWFKMNADLQCSNIISLPDGIGDIAIPTTVFNVIYQLSHLQHHFFYEGVGLRQVIDYYFNMGKLNDENIEVLQRNLKHLGLWKFAGAVMWVLHEILGLPTFQMIAPMDKKRGKLLLDEILSGGNFGQYSRQKRFGRGTLGHNIQRLQRDLRLMRYYPAETLTEPFFRVWHFLWRKKNKV